MRGTYKKSPCIAIFGQFCCFFKLFIYFFLYGNLEKNLIKTFYLLDFLCIILLALYNYILN
jgi:hypothetical protein